MIAMAAVTNLILKIILFFVVVIISVIDTDNIIVVRSCLCGRNSSVQFSTVEYHDEGERFEI